MAKIYSAFEDKNGRSGLGDLLKVDSHVVLVYSVLFFILLIFVAFTVHVLEELHIRSNPHIS